LLQETWPTQNVSLPIETQHANAIVRHLPDVPRETITYVQRKVSLPIQQVFQDELIGQNHRILKLLPPPISPNEFFCPERITTGHFCKRPGYGRGDNLAIAPKDDSIYWVDTEPFVPALLENIRQGPPGSNLAKFRADITPGASIAEQAVR